MRLRFHPRIAEQLADAPPSVRRGFDKQVALLAENLRHPSLRAKKYDKANDVWQARVTKGWRFYFQIEDDTYTILSVRAHPK
jgi:mRNA-degrading endonuclease RelE of RelBE toxin-antitoxin system